jgi:hypothetical protein
MSASTKRLVTFASLAEKWLSRGGGEDFWTGYRVAARRLRIGGGTQTSNDFMYWAACAQWLRAGCNVISPSADLVAALLMTESPRHFWPEAIRAPLGSFVIQIAPGIIPWSDRMGWLRYIFVCEAQNLSDGSPEMVTIASNCLGFYEDGILRTDGHGVHAVTSTVSSVRAAAPSAAPRVVGDNPNPGLTRRLSGVALRVAINVAAWMSAHRANPASKARRGGGRRDRGDEATPSAWVLGGEIKLSPEMRRAALDLAAAGTGDRKSGWKLQLRHVVRGHWRNQAVGPAHADRRMTWIAPYWKGPEGAAAWAHVYRDACAPGVHETVRDQASQANGAGRGAVDQEE